MGAREVGRARQRATCEKSASCFTKRTTRQHLVAGAIPEPVQCALRALAVCELLGRADGQCVKAAVLAACGVALVAATRCCTVDGTTILALQRQHPRAAAAS